MTAGLVAVALAALSVVLGGLYLVSVEQPRERVRSLVDRETERLAAIDRGGGQSALIDALRERRSTPSPQKPFDALIGRDGRLISGNLPSWPHSSDATWLNIEADLYRDGDEDDHEALSRDLEMADGRRLIVGRDVELLSDREELIVQAALWGLIAILIVAPIGGLLVSQSVARRIDDISRTALAVMTGDLAGRVPVKGTGDDFDRLAQTLNSMLDRIEELVASLARVSDHVAHELRTPLARLRASLEMLPAAEDSETKARLVEQGVAEAIRLQTTFDALLRVARLDTGRHSIARDEVRFDQLVRDAVDFYAPEAEQRDQRLAADLDHALVRGDPDLLFQAVTNLIDNAVKFTPRGGSIMVRLRAYEDGPMLTVRDSGPGVDDADRARLSERFYRAPGSDSIPGSGLGLSLVDAIVRAHDGSLSFAGHAGAFEAVLDFRPRDRSNSAT